MASCYQPDAKATLFREQIEMFRRFLTEPGLVANYEPEHANALCDMALASLSPAVGQQQPDHLGSASQCSEAGVSRASREVFNVRVDCYAENDDVPVTQWFLVRAETRSEAIYAATKEAECKADASKRWVLFQWRSAAVAKFPMLIVAPARDAAEITSKPSEQNVRASREAVLAPREQLEKLRQTHNVCEDCWYSCPKSGECCDERQGSDCNCGADKHNAIIDALLKDHLDDAYPLPAQTQDNSNAQQKGHDRHD